ncbi:MAG: hypothetical protein EBU12_00595 [Microbacteriaceae bacterium]|nr:hypothetical protein [Microbacteriaceae bacterium]
MESNQYQPPVRKSLTYEELAARVEYATSTRMGLEAMMDLVVAQEALRAQEDKEIEEWLEQMEANGSPEALRAAENFRRTQSGLSALPQVESEPVVEEVTTTTGSFSWFTQPDPEEEGVQETVVAETPVEEVIEVEEAIEEEAIEEEAIVAENVLEETIPEEQKEVQGWSLVESTPVEPVGTETEDEFEHLLSSAAAEEEMTALEELDNESNTHPEAEVDATSNTLIPSDEHRNRKPVSQLLVWLGVSATIVPVLLTWLLITFGLSANAVIADLFAGYFVAGTVIATASLAGKRSGLSTSIVSRAVFGVWGNAIPGTLVFIVRATVAALLVAFTALVINGTDSSIPNLTESVTSIGSFNLTVGLIASAIAVLLVTAIGFIRGVASRVLQIALSSAALAAILVALIGISSKNLALVTPGVSEISSKESLLGFALVVMVVTVLWAAVAPNLAKAIPMRERGLRVFGWVAIANFVIPALVAIAALSWLGPRAKQLAVIVPLDLNALLVIVMELPQYSRISLVIGVAVTLTYALLLTLKTAALDLSALLPVKRISASLLTVVVVIGALVLFSAQPLNVALNYLVNIFILVSLFSAGWIGMLVTDVALRRIAYHELSLSRSYGFYKRFSIISISSWLVSVASAIAFIPVNLKGLDFTGFGLESIGLERNEYSAPIGFLITVAAGVILTLIVRIPEIRKQEREVLQVESRREQLNNIFLGQE